MKPIFGKSVPTIPAEPEPLALCRTCGNEPATVTRDGMTAVTCEHCDVWTVRCATPEEAWALWNEKPVHP